MRNTSVMVMHRTMREEHGEATDGRIDAQTATFLRKTRMFFFKTCSRKNAP